MERAPGVYVRPSHFGRIPVLVAREQMAELLSED
jgi:hypothetical protein